MKAFIIDDEPDCISIIEHYLNVDFPQIEIIGTAPSVRESIIILAEFDVDLLFLDIHLQDGTGFDILKSLPVRKFMTVFTTTYDEFAIKAIKHSALDYILKPIDQDELRSAVTKAYKNMFKTDLKNNSSLMLDNDHPSRLKLPTLSGFRLIEIDDLIRCEADRNYTVFHMNNGEKIVVSKTLKTFEKILTENNRFVRIHQTHIVNFDSIKEYIKGRGGEVILKNGKKIVVAESKKSKLLKLFN